MISLDDQIRGIWFVAWDGADFLAALSKHDDGYVLEWRISVHRDENSPSQDDYKHWKIMRASNPQDESSLTAVVTHLCSVLKCKPNGEAWELLRGDQSLEEFEKRFLALPFVHVRSDFSPGHA